MVNFLNKNRIHRIAKWLFTATFAFSLLSFSTFARITDSPSPIIATTELVVSTNEPVASIFVDTILTQINGSGDDPRLKNKFKLACLHFQRLIEIKFELIYKNDFSATPIKHFIPIKTMHQPSKEDHFQPLPVSCRAYCVI